MHVYKLTMRGCVGENSEAADRDFRRLFAHQEPGTTVVMGCLTNEHDNCQFVCKTREPLHITGDTSRLLELVTDVTEMPESELDTLVEAMQEHIIARLEELVGEPMPDELRQEFLDKINEVNGFDVDELAPEPDNGMGPFSFSRN